MDNNHSFILFSIDPVQDFISQARKAQDLWMGSYLLSYLNAKAIFHLKDTLKLEDKDFIFPDIKSNPIIDFIDGKETGDYTIPSIPNLFLVQIEKGKEKEEEAMKCLEGIESHLRNYFSDMAMDSAIEAFGEPKVKNTYMKQIIDRQSPGFLNIKYIIYTPGETDKDYAKNFEKTTRAMASLKNLRTFDFVEEPGRKCSLCGEREVLHKQKDDNHGYVGDQWKRSHENRPYIGRQDEALCSVCLLKRLGIRVMKKDLKEESKFIWKKLNEMEFPSTSEIATAYFKEKIFSSEIKNKYRDFVAFFKGLAPAVPTVNRVTKFRDNSIYNIINIDGIWLYEENLSNNFIKKNLGVDIDNEKIKDLQKKREELQKQVGFKPGKHYALILMDGDSMGKHLQEIGSVEEHKKISSGLKKFAEEKVKKIVEEEHFGKLIYAGGDDVLAIIHPVDLMSAIKKLRDAYGECLEETTGKGDFTASMGVCITHYKTPASTVLKWAKSMEKAAKGIDGKDSFGLCLVKHSGGIRKTVHKWQYNEVSPFELFDLLIECRKDFLSDKFVYNIREEFSSLTDKDGKIPENLLEFIKNDKDTDKQEKKPTLPYEPIRLEIGRLLNRASDGKKKKPEKIALLTDWLHQIFMKNPKLNIFVDMLEIINFLAEETIKAKKPEANKNNDENQEGGN